MYAKEPQEPSDKATTGVVMLAWSAGGGISRCRSGEDSGFCGGCWKMSLWLPAHPCQEIQSARGLQTSSCYVHLLTSTWIHSAVFWWEVLSVIGFQSPGFSLPMGWYMGSTSRNVCLVFLPCLIPSANVCYKTFFSALFVIHSFKTHHVMQKLCALC